MALAVRVCALVALCFVSNRALAAQAPLASLDSAWASIERTYFDTALVRGAWRGTYDSLRTRVAQGDDDAVRAAIRALIAVPGKSHFALIPGDAAPAPSAPRSGRAPGTLGIDVRTIGDTLVVWRVEPRSPAALAGIRAGAAITKVGAIGVDTLFARLRRAFPGDERQVRLLAAAAAKSRLAGSAGDTIRFAVRDLRARRERAHALVAVPQTGRTTQFGNLPPMVVRATRDSVAVRTSHGVEQVPVIGFNGWFPAVVGDLDSMLFGARHAPAIIIDLRGNPGGVVGMINGVSGHFTDTAVTLGTMYGRGATIALRSNPRLVNPRSERVGVLTAPVAILVDEFTASSSEFFAAGLQGIGRARVFGVASAGQALPALMARLPNGDVLMHPIADHIDAAGRRVEGIGVQPEVVTPLTRRDLAAGRDLTLEAAQRWIADTLRTSHSPEPRF